MRFESKIEIWVDIGSRNWNFGRYWVNINILCQTRQNDKKRQFFSRIAYKKSVKKADLMKKRGKHSKHWKYAISSQSHQPNSSKWSKTRFCVKLLIKKSVNDPPIQFLSKIWHCHIVLYTKLNLHARNQQNIMNSYRETDRRLLSLLQKSLRPHFPIKKFLKKIFTTPQKSLHRRPRPSTRPLDHSHRPYYHQYP